MGPLPELSGATLAGGEGNAVLLSDVGKTNLCTSDTQAKQAYAHQTPRRKFMPDQTVMSLVGYPLPETLSPTILLPGGNFCF